MEDVLSALNTIYTEIKDIKDGLGFQNARMNELSNAMTQFMESVDASNQNVPTAFCSCMGNDVDVMSKPQ